MTLTLSLACLALLALAVTTLQVIHVVRLRRGAVPAPAIRPFVSILKPLAGLDAGLEENLVSFACLEGLSYEVVLSVADAGDPALAAVENVRRRFPDAPFTLVIGGELPGRFQNRKVERLEAAAWRARGEIYLISDSNVRVEPRDVARTLALFEDPRVGLVSNVFVAEDARSLGARIEALHLLTFVLPGAAIAAAHGVACVVGKSMALRRGVLEEIGGFAAVGNVLGEDQALGLAVQRAGYRVLLSPVVARNVLGERTAAQALARQVRWGKIRYAFSRATYASEVLTNPLPLAIAAFLAAGSAAPAWLAATAALGSVTLLARVLQALVLDRVTGGYLGRGTAWLMPLKDLLQLGTWIEPFLSREVEWHGHRARLGRGTRLLPSRRRLAAAA